MNPYLLPWMIVPTIPTDNPKPPTVYALLNSIVNFDNPNPAKIKNLASEGRNVFFDFDYPLSSNIEKADFECMILNKFMMRRIGFDTLTAFKIQLNVKLNEIMPQYNLLFDAIEGWDLFNDGETTTITISDNTTSANTTSASNSSISSATNTSDRRNSNTPQTNLTDVQNGSYISEYNYDTDTANANDTSQSSATYNGTNSNTKNETRQKSPADKIKLYKDFIEAKNNIYSMIFKDLDILFYQLG